MTLQPINEKEHPPKNPARKPPPRRRSERCNGNKASLVSRPDFELLPDSKSPRSSAAATESRLSLGASRHHGGAASDAMGNKASLVSRPDFELLPDSKSPRSSAAATESRLSLGAMGTAWEIEERKRAVKKRPKKTKGFGTRKRDKSFFVWYNLVEMKTTPRRYYTPRQGKIPVFVSDFLSISDPGHSTDSWRESI